MQASDKTTVQEETRLFIATQGSKEQKMNKSTDGHKESILELHHQYKVKHPLFWSPLLNYSPVVSSLPKNKGINTTAPLGREGGREGGCTTTKPPVHIRIITIAVFLLTSSDISCCPKQPSGTYGCEAAIPASSHLSCSSLLLLQEAKGGQMEKLFNAPLSLHSIYRNTR